VKTGVVRVPDFSSGSGSGYPEPNWNRVQSVEPGPGVRGLGEPDWNRPRPFPVGFFFLDLKSNWNQAWFFSGSNNWNRKCFFLKKLGFGSNLRIWGLKFSLGSVV